MSRWFIDKGLPGGNQFTENMVNVLNFKHFSLLFLKNVGFQGWNPQNACQNLKYERPWSDQSDLGLCRLSRPFLQATSVRNFRTFTVCDKYPYYMGWPLFCCTYISCSILRICCKYLQEASQKQPQTCLVSSGSPGLGIGLLGLCTKPPWLSFGLPGFIYGL